MRQIYMAINLITKFRKLQIKLQKSNSKKASFLSMKRKCFIVPNASRFPEVLALWSSSHKLVYKGKKDI